MSINKYLLDTYNEKVSGREGKGDSTSLDHCHTHPTFLTQH